MAEFLKKIPTNLTEYPNSFKRQGAFPLEAYSVFYTKAEADTYAASDPLAYVGQTIAVALDDAVTLYVIDQNSTLKEVGSLPVGDDQSVTVVDGKIQLVNFGTSPNGAVAQIEVAEDGTRTLVWTPVTDLVADTTAKVEELEKVINEDTKGENGETTQVALIKTFADVDYNATTGNLTFKDTQGNEVDSVNLNIQALVKSVEYMATATVNGQVFTNVLVLTDANNNKTVVELDDLLNIYTTEQNATDVQLTITSTDGGADADTNVISAKLTDAIKEAINKGVTAYSALKHTEADTDVVLDSEETNFKVVIKDNAITSEKLADGVKADIGKGVVAHEGLSHSSSDVELNYSEELGEHRVLLKDSVRTDINKGVTAYNALFDGTTTFVLNGGNASGYTVATDESTEV